MYPHRRSYSQSTWQNSQYTPSRMRQSSTKLKRQYYYYSDAHESFPSFADTPFHLNESSINEDYGRGGNSRWSLFQEQPSKSYGSRFEDTNAQLRKIGCQKMKNLEKINNKIKKILHTLDQEEKKITANNYRFYQPQRKPEARIKTEGDNWQNRQQPTIYSQLHNIREKYEKRQNQQRQSFLSNFNSQSQSRQYQERSRLRTENLYEKENQLPPRYKSISKNPVDTKYKESFRRQKQGEQDHFTFHQKIQPYKNLQDVKVYETPVKEYAACLKRSQVEQETRAKHFKNFDEEISKIQQKINSFEKLKKELNIQ